MKDTEALVLKFCILVFVAVLYLPGCTPAPLVARFASGDVVEVKGTALRGVVVDSVCTAHACVYAVRPLDGSPDAKIPQVLLERATPVAN